MDSFDALMNSRVDVYETGIGSPDGYKQPNQTFTLKQASVPCRIGTIRSSREFKVSKEGRVGSRMVYMRPTTSYGFDMNEHYWLKFENVYWNIISSDAIYDRAGAQHHLEILVERVTG